MQAWLFFSDSRFWQPPQIQVRSHIVAGDLLSGPAYALSCCLLAVRLKCVLLFVCCVLWQGACVSFLDRNLRSLSTSLLHAAGEAHYCVSSLLVLPVLTVLHF